jgi:preprotein translocase SecF subunit
MGSEQVKGFALTLMLGLAANLFTAVFVCRLMSDILQRNHWVERFRMWAILSRPNFDFVGKRFVAVAGSGALILAGLIGVGLRGSGLLDIDFTGGTAAVIQLDKPVPIATVRRLTDQVLPDATVEEVQLHNAAPDTRFLVRSTVQDAEQVKASLTKQFGNPKFDQLDNFGGDIIQSTQQAALVAIVVSIVAIAAYLWIRFQNVLFGLATVVALVHDVLVVLGLVALSHWLAGNVVGNLLGLDSFKINLSIIAAFLTLVGYSINDTIVVFDRIREVRGRNRAITWELINSAVNQTLSRTILTSFTAWLVAVVLYVVGGAAIHGMAFCLVTGVIVGTYSSVYIAAPVLIWFGRQDNGREKKSNTPPSIARQGRGPEKKPNTPPSPASQDNGSRRATRKAGR